MDEKEFKMIEQIYVELKSFKSEVNQRFDKVDERFERIDEQFEKIDERFERIDEQFDKVDERFEKIEHRLVKSEINGESLHDKISECFEAINTLSETNDRQHKEILDELRGRINIVEKAVKKVAL